MITKYTAETLKQYEDFLESLQLFPQLFKIKDMEMDLKGELNPSFCLDDLFFNKMKWLSFSQFFDYYFELHKETIKQRFGYSGYNSFSEALRARLYRTQFGFLTEYHAFFLSSILFGNEHVCRSFDLDKAGVDFQINLNNQVYNIHIFVDTPRAWSFRTFKSKHKNVDALQGIHTNLPYSLQPGRFNSLRFLKNRFGVYTQAYLKYFEQEATSGRIKNNNIAGTGKNGFIYSC